MKRRIINFGDIQLFGAVGEWGLVLTDLAGANEQDILLPSICCFSLRNLASRQLIFLAE
jgi:hypothetical protein